MLVRTRSRETETETKRDRGRERKREREERDRQGQKGGGRRERETETETERSALVREENSRDNAGSSCRKTQGEDPRTYPKTVERVGGGFAGPGLGVIKQ